MMRTEQAPVVGRGGLGQTLSEADSSWCTPRRLPKDWPGKFAKESRPGGELRKGMSKLEFPYWWP